jgi:lipoprotein NlpI
LRLARKLIISAFALCSSIALADSDSETPLFDYATSLPVVSQPFNEALNKQIATFTAEMARHPPPPDVECAQTLGASRFARMYDDLGAVQSNAGDTEAAITAFEKALACTPRAVSIHGELAAEFLNAGRIAEARAAAARGTAIDNENAGLDSVLMQLDFIEEHWADAVARLRAMIASQKDDERATYYLCFLWLAQRRAGIEHPELVEHSFDKREWPAPILGALQGELSEAKLLEKVREEKNEVRRREILVEALYYTGQMRLANGERETARRYFAAVVNLKVLYFIEHHLALAEIMKLRD